MAVHSSSYTNNISILHKLKIHAHGRGFLVMITTFIIVQLGYCFKLATNQ